MLKGSYRLYLRIAVLCAIGSMLSVTECIAQREQSAAESSVKRFLQGYVGISRSAEDKTTRYFASFVDLGGNGKQDVIVYVTGQEWCGSGGCTTLILAPSDASYKVVTKITVSRPPICVLPTKSNGWHDISVRVQGGGIQTGYEAHLSFDGKSYPNNPSALPARPLTEKERGEVIVPARSEGRPLYD
jgi:hypothetical protein